jgi:ribosome-binding ATPase YchF (GTP1/OBG family)
VDYAYESAGQKRSEGLYDPYEWHVKRSVTLVAELAAQAPTAMPTLQALDAAQTAQLKSLGDKSQAVATKMAPMMADVEKMMAKCGEDEACLTRETQKMGAAMRGTPQMATAMSAKQDAREFATAGTPRYQAWRATAQKGSFRIDETVHRDLSRCFGGRAIGAPAMKYAPVRARFRCHPRRRGTHGPLQASQPSKSTTARTR